MPNANPNNTNIVIIPTIAFFSVIPSGLYPKEAGNIIKKHFGYYVIISAYCANNYPSKESA